jgi:hypothetical protein
MRAPRRRRPRRRWIAAPTGRDLDAVASAARYCGSPEHKDTPSFAGQPKPRADASICDRSFASDRGRPQAWLTAAIRRGIVSEDWEGDFPRYVWYKEEATVYEARLVNRTQGWYKGFPLKPEEWPPGIERSYE